MGNIVNLQSFISDKKYYDDIIPFFHSVNPYFINYKEGEQAVFILNNDMYIFIFLQYVYPGVFTSFPAVKDCFHEYRLKNRKSEGEWVVESFEEVDFEKATNLMNELKSIEGTNVFNFIKNVIHK